MTNQTLRHAFRFLHPTGFRLVLALALLGAFALPGLVQADDPHTFMDALTGPSSPYLDIPFAKFSYTAVGLRRTASLSGTSNGTDRPVVRTIAGDFLGRNFVYEIELRTESATQDIAFVGFGRGATNPSFFNEPTDSAVFRIHHLVALVRVDIAIALGVSGSPFTVFRENVGSYVESGTTFRIERFDDTLTMSIVGSPASSRSFSVSADLAFLDNATSYLFFGNSAEGTTFRKMKVESQPLQPSVSDLCPCAGPLSGGTWKNHGKYVSCVAHEADAQVEAGILTEAEADALISAAGQSSCGK